MGNKNAFEGHKPAEAPPFVRPQQLSDKTPRALDMKKEILRDVQKIVVVGDVTKIFDKP